jgi:hypothetical protein
MFPLGRPLSTLARAAEGVVVHPPQVAPSSASHHCFCMRTVLQQWCSLRRGQASSSARRPPPAVGSCCTLSALHLYAARRQLRGSHKRGSGVGGLSRGGHHEP